MIKLTIPLLSVNEVVGLGRQGLEYFLLNWVDSARRVAGTTFPDRFGSAHHRKAIFLDT